MRISVVLPIYNVQNYLEQCVQSLIEQTYKDIEILLVDDGSTDKSGEICDKLATKDDRITVFHKENGGTHTARNLGIQKASGEYVMFLDPDDWLDTDTFEKLAAKIQESTPDVIRFNYVREFEDRSVKKENTFLEQKVYEGQECKKVCRQTVGLIGEELKNPENFNFLASACFSLYKREMILKNNLEFFNIRKIATFSDGLFNISFLLKANKFQYVDECFYHYRKFTSGAATSKYREDFLSRQLVMFDYMKDLIKDADDEDFLKAYANRIVLSSMEMCLNVFKSDKSVALKFAEIKDILNSEIHKSAYKNLTLRDFPTKWKVYFFFIKHRLTAFVYIMTFLMRQIQRKG